MLDRKHFLLKEGELYKFGEGAGYSLYTSFEDILENQAEINCAIKYKGNPFIVLEIKAYPSFKKPLSEQTIVKILIDNKIFCFRMNNTGFNETKIFRI